MFVMKAHAMASGTGGDKNGANKLSAGATNNYSNKQTSTWNNFSEGATRGTRGRQSKTGRKRGK